MMHVTYTVYEERRAYRQYTDANYMETISHTPIEYGIYGVLYALAAERAISSCCYGVWN
jgi:hypothetical protein